PAVGTARNQGAAPGSRRLRQFALCAHAGRHRQSFRSAVQLGLRNRAASSDEGPAHVLAARPPPWRLEFGQCHGLYARAADYDHWRQLGNAGWSYDDVLPYFKKAERNERLHDRFHGEDGPLNVAERPYTNPLSHVFVEAAQQAGLPFNPDFNGAVQLGCGLFQVTQKNGRRWSAASAYLHPAAARENLTIVTKAQATRVLITAARSGSNMRAGESAALRTPRKTWCSPPARSTRRNCCCCQASGRPTSCERAAFRWCMICQASARICRIISTSTSCSAPSASPRSTARIAGLRRSAWRVEFFSTGPDPGPAKSPRPARSPSAGSAPR